MRRQPDLGLGWCGTSSVAHLEENLAVDTIHLDSDNLAALEHVTQLAGPGF